jgi:hypothetical protein
MNILVLLQCIQSIISKTGVRRMNQVVQAICTCKFKKIPPREVFLSLNERKAIFKVGGIWPSPFKKYFTVK